MNNSSNSSFVNNSKPLHSYFKDEEEIKQSATNSKQNSQDISLSKLLDVKSNKIQENKDNQKKSELLSKKIDSDKEITNKENILRKDVKMSTVIKKFGESAKLKQNQSEVFRDSILKNLNVSTFQKLAQKNDPLVQSIFMNSKLVNSIGQHFMKNASKYEQKLEECHNWNKKFTDQDFPPDESSLSGDWQTLSSKQQTSWKKFVWRRAEEIFGKDYDVFLDSIEPNDIKQGQLGDCYLLSSLSSLAERDYLVRKLFQPEIRSDCGLYSIWLNVNGIWTNILIDDYFPCLNGKSGPAFSRGNGNELWVLILEKAYAKVFGSYHAIEGGNPAVALRDLIGAPYENKDEGDEDEMWEYIKVNDEAGFILTCYTRSTMIVEEENDLGLLSGHAYAILDHQEVVGSTGKTERIIKIRNPWGKKEWKGRWSDDSPEWTEELKKKLNEVIADDGTFWIDIADFRKYYEGVGICKYHENYFFDSISLNLSKKFAVVHMKLTKDCHVYISLNQKDERMFLFSGKNHQYSYMRLLLAKITPTKLEYIGGEFKQDQVLTIETDLFAGDYFILLEIEWMHNLYTDLVLSTYGNIHSVLEEKNDLTEKEFLQMQRNIIKSYALTNPSNQKKGDFNKFKNSDIKTFSAYEFGILYFYYTNESPKTLLEETMTMTKLINLQICPPLEDNNNINLILLPKTEAVVMFKFVPSDNPSTTYGYKTNSKITEEKLNLKKIKYPEIYKVNYEETSNLIDNEANYNPKKIIIDNELQGNLEIKEKPLKKVEKMREVQKEGNKTLENEEYWWVSEKEKQISANLDNKIGDKISNWGQFFSISLHIALIFVWFACFLRSDFLNLSIIVCFEASLLGKTIKQKWVRIYFYTFLFSFIQDIVWLSVYTYDWVSELEYEPETLNPLKRCAIAFSFLDILYKPWILFCTWRFSIDYENMKKSVLGSINPLSMTSNETAPVPEDHTEISRKQ